MKIILIRKAKGITQAELAQLCETTQQQIARIETGAVDPRLSTLRRIADALGCELPELFYTRDEFLAAVRTAAAERQLDLRTASMLDVNTVAARYFHVPSFHPYWEKLTIKEGQIHEL